MKIKMKSLPNHWAIRRWNWSYDVYREIIPVLLFGDIYLVSINW